jgi:hypothetical protein
MACRTDQPGVLLSINRYPTLVDVQRRSGTAMGRILFLILVAVSLARVGHAQETAGTKGEAARREIIQLEKEKAQALQSSSPADWFDRHDADDVDYTNADGTVMTKAQHLAEWRSGELKLRAVERPDYHVRIYENGNTAVVTYLSSQTVEFKGKASTLHTQVTDAFVKQDGIWRSVVHHVTSVPHSESGR